MRLSWPRPDLPADVVVGLVGPGAPFELVMDDRSGLRRPVFANRPRSIIEVLAAGAERFGDRPYLVFPERTVTFGSVVDAVARVAAEMATRFAVGPGDRVGVASANRLEFALTVWATAALGAVTVAFNGWWTGPELAYAVGLTRPRVVFADDRRMERLTKSEVDVSLCSFEQEFCQFETAHVAPALPTVRVGEDDPFVILFTSGTTGRPKGVPISHRNAIHFSLAAQLRGAELRARATLAGAEPVTPFLPCAIGASPMFHVSGLTCTMIPAPMTGLTTVYPPPGRWEEPTHLRLTEQHQATGWSLVPTQLWRLLEWPELDRYDLGSLRTVTGGSAVWPPELLRRLEQRLPWVRPALGLGYGMTETNGLGTTLGGPATFTHPDSVGEPSPTVEIEIRHPVDHRPLGEDEVGEIALRTASTVDGYWEDPVATAAAIDGDGWYHTDDLGFHRGGFVYLAGRRDDLIIRGGENVSPAEIENRLYEHASVAEAAVIGVAHPTLGQQVKAFVVLKDGSVAEAHEIRSFCGRALAAFKVPEQIEIVPALPHNASGKVLKHLLARGETVGDFVEE